LRGVEGKKMVHSEGPAEIVEGRIVVDGHSYSLEALGKILRLWSRLQCWEMRAILKEYCPGYEPFERLAAYESVEEIDAGCRLVTETKSLTLSRVFGLELAWWGWQEATPEEFRRLLRERMQRLGDRITEAWQKDRKGW